MQDTFDSKRERINKHCPYKSRHFCDGKPNLSVVKEGDTVKPKPPCPLNKECPVRNPRVDIEQARSYGEGIDKLKGNLVEEKKTDCLKCKYFILCSMDKQAFFKNSSYECDEYKEVK